MTGLQIVMLVAGAAAAVSNVFWDRAQRRRYGGLTARAEQEFRALRLEASDPTLCFHGATATVVREQREFLDKSMRIVVRIQRYACNEHGEYFFFISEGTGKPFFKHVGQAAAKAALGSKYVAPQRQDEA